MDDKTCLYAYNQVMREFIQKLCAEDFENEVVEFKLAQRSYDFNKLGKYFSALSNEANLNGQSNAWIVFGVEDEGKVIAGTTFRTDRVSLMSLKGEIAAGTIGNLTFSEIYEEFLNVDGESRRVLLFKIPAAPSGIPVSWKGHYYGRDGEELGALHINELETIRNQVLQSDWSAGICSDATIDDLDPAAMDRALVNYKIKHPNLVEEVDQWDTEIFLNKAKLTIDGKITRTALLLLGKSEAAHHLSPGVARITWILKDANGVEKDYEHFDSPLLLGIENLFRKIRMIRYRYMLDDTIFPEEVDQYDPYLIREALNNAIAHQDYEKQGRVVVIEKEDDSLTFLNEGGFLPGSVKAVIMANTPSTTYRNQFLVAAMVNLNLIDTIGSGIRKMFKLQRERFFPMPEYVLTNEKVCVSIVGKVLDVKYATKLAKMPTLHLEDIFLLDQVQKGNPLSDQEISRLRKMKLVEGRKPNLHISSSVAAKTDQAVDYMKQKGVDNSYCRKVILETLEKFGRTGRDEFVELLSDKLSDNLDPKQKVDRVRNVLQALRKEGEISYNEDLRKWELSSQR